MLNASPYGSKSTLGPALSSTATTMAVRPGTGHLFDPGTGNHVWVTIRSGARVERVKVIGRSGDILTLAFRGGDGTTAQSWSGGECVSVEWNPSALCEYIQQCMNNAPTPTGVNAGTYCLDSCMCIEVANDGRIVKINGAGGC